VEANMNDADPDIDPRIAALADGTLTGDERDELAAGIEASPALREQLREQEHAVSLMRATDSIVAPAALRASINELTAPARAKRSRRSSPAWRPRVFMPLATGVAIAVVALVIALQGSPAPSIDQTAHFALSAATGPPPAEEATDSDRLTAHVGSVRFPSYEKENGWRASGMRSDTIHGRTVTTVFYRAPTGTRVGYAIVSGSPLAAPGGQSVTRQGTRYVFSNVGSGRYVTWWQGGHTCVIAGHAVSNQKLLSLATAEQDA
jgi:hypothetical protein